MAPITVRLLIPNLEWTENGVRFLDQTRLPLEETYVLATTYAQVAGERREALELSIAKSAYRD